MARFHRKFEGRRLVVASHNAGKLNEIAALLRPFDIETIAAAALGLSEPEETGTTFQANAELKARAAAIAGGLPALADDSGLCIHALGGAPGVHTVDWMGPEKSSATAIERARHELKAVPEAQRSAHMACALSLAWPDRHTESFEGRVDGRLVFPARGSAGFGFDPVFVPDGEAATFAELGLAKKHAMSHRARAFAKLIAACFDARG
jgi:XTP/dITP diphosphohydrolase